MSARLTAPTRRCAASRLRRPMLRLRAAQHVPLPPLLNCRAVALSTPVCSRPQHRPGRLPADFGHAFHSRRAAATIEGNEYLEQKKFAEAIEWYSRSITLSPMAVAFASRAMMYLKLRKQEADNDCTEALNLDDRYVKAYSRRITARKGPGKLKEAMDDAEFALSVDANNPELRKQYSEIRALLVEKITKRSSVQDKHTTSEFDKSGDSKDSTSHPPSYSHKDSFREVDLLGELRFGLENSQVACPKEDLV